MEGAALRNKHELNVALFGAWHTALFGLNGYADKGRLARGKALSDLMFDTSSLEDRPDSPNHAQAIAFFHRLRARGLPVEISRNQIN